MGITIVDDLIDSVESNRSPRASIHDGRAALEIAIGLRESHRRGGMRVNLPLEDRSLKMMSVETKEDHTPARVRRLQAG
jgi:hypothetical protein